MQKSAITAALSIVQYVLLAAILGTSVVPPCAAQPEESFGVMPMSGPNGMLLMIGGPMLHSDVASANGGWVGYHIYRKSDGDSAFTRVTTKPLARPGSLEELEAAMGGKIDGFERFAGLANKQVLWEKIIQNDSSVAGLSYLSKSFRKALGMLIWDTNVERNKTYEYQATMVASDGKESKPSPPQRATFGVPLIPIVGPLHVIAESTPAGVALRWEMNPADSGMFSFSVYRCPDSVGAFLRLNLAPLSFVADSGLSVAHGTFVDTTALAARTYYYAVVSSDYAGNDSPRAPLVTCMLTDIAAPSIPQNVFANPGDLGIAVTWEKVPSSDLTGYNIYRSDNPDSLYVRINSVLLPADTGYFLDKSATTVDRYFYRVASVDQSGNESERSARSVSLYEDYLQPLPPQNVRAESLPGGIRVTWQASDEPSVRGYYVFRADSYDGALSQISPLYGRDTCEYLDSARYLSARGQYWYLVQSINYAGISSQYSSPVTAAPQKPESPDVPRSFFGYVDDSGVRLFWAGPDDNVIDGYRVYRAAESDTLAWSALTAISMPRTRGDYTDTTVQTGANYVYQLRSVNREGTESQASHNVRISVFEPVPLPPGQVRIVKNGLALSIAWDRVYQPSVIGYRVYRRTEREAVTVLTPQVIPTAQPEYRDNTAKPSISYYYSVACVDNAGREGSRSTEVSFVIQ